MPTLGSNLPVMSGLHIPGSRDGNVLRPAGGAHTHTPANSLCLSAFPPPVPSHAWLCGLYGQIFPAADGISARTVGTHTLPATLGVGVISVSGNGGCYSEKLKLIKSKITFYGISLAACVDMQPLGRGGEAVKLFAVSLIPICPSV